MMDMYSDSSNNMCVFPTDNADKLHAIKTGPYTPSIICSNTSLGQNSAGEAAPYIRIQDMAKKRLWLLITRLYSWIKSVHRFGALQNRFENTVSNLQALAETCSLLSCAFRY